MIVDLTAAEQRVVALLREIKTTTGHGTLTVEIRNGVEEQFVPARKEKPPK